MDFLIVGNGMFGAATARYLAPHATVTVVGPQTREDGSGGYGAHHDEGRIIGDLSRDIVWKELNRLSREGMTTLDPALITPCGALTVTTPDGPGYLRVAAEIRERHGADIRVMDADQASARFPMARFGPDETILHQPAAGHFSPRRYVALATQSARAAAPRSSPLPSGSGAHRRQGWKPNSTTAGSSTLRLQSWLPARSPPAQTCYPYRWHCALNLRSTRWPNSMISRQPTWDGCRVLTGPSATRSFQTCT